MPGTSFIRMRSRWVWAAVALLGIGSLSFVFSAYRGLSTVAPSGDYEVGRWQGAVQTESGGFGAVVWYPAEPGTGTSSPYFADLEALADDLIASGELSSFEVRGLRFVRDGALDDAEVAATATGWSVLIFSPGNATNVEFYASIASELASSGYVVVGLNHLRQVPVAVVPAGVVLYEQPPRPPTDEAYQALTTALVDARVRDLSDALDWLAAMPPDALIGALNLESVGAFGHSLGGIAAAEACASDSRIDACLNFDGLQAGGPYGTARTTTAVDQPFMFVTKEETLRPEHEALLESGGLDTFRVVIPGADHGEFSDGASFTPSLQPWDADARDTLVVARGFALRFFDRYLRGAPSSMDGVSAPRDVIVYGYPFEVAAAR